MAEVSKICGLGKTSPAFSSNKGEDFKAVLEALCKIKTENTSVPRNLKKTKLWEKKCRTYHGRRFLPRMASSRCPIFRVPQRRRRIYLVADLMANVPEKILFESEGLSGYSSPGSCSWKELPGAVESSTGTAEQSA